MTEPLNEENTKSWNEIPLDRIKFDLYKDLFINPDTATYGIKYVDNEITPESLTDRQILQDELGRLCLIQNKYVDDEEYEKAEIMKRKITQLQNKIDKL